MIAPPFLKNNDQVAVIGTAKNYENNALDAAMIILQSWGLQVVPGKNLYKKHHQFAGTDQERAADLQEALNNPDIKAIFCARGGYGTSRIIDSIDFSQFMIHPKWVVGYSDITVLHGYLNRMGFQSIHGIMPVSFAKAGYEQSLSSLRSALFGKPVSFYVPFHPLNRLGATQSLITGGNLTMLHTCLKTASEVDLKQKILFIEDIGEYFYHLDRMMVHLKRAGILEHLSGLVVGDFTDMKDNDHPFGKNAFEIIADAVKDYSFPTAYGFPIGHEPFNLSLICGSFSNFEVKSSGSTLEFQPAGILPVA